MYSLNYFGDMLDKFLNVCQMIGKNLPLKKMNGTQTFNTCLELILLIAFGVLLFASKSASFWDKFLAFIFLGGTTIFCYVFTVLLPKFK